MRNILEQRPDGDGAVQLLPNTNNGRPSGTTQQSSNIFDCIINWTKGESLKYKFTTNKKQLHVTVDDSQVWIFFDSGFFTIRNPKIINQYPAGLSKDSDGTWKCENDVMVINTNDGETYNSNNTRWENSSNKSSGCSPISNPGVTFNLNYPGDKKYVYGKKDNEWYAKNTSNGKIFNMTKCGYTNSIKNLDNYSKTSGIGTSQTNQSKYKDCYGSYSLGCKSPVIQKVQGCLGITSDGRFGTKTQKALKDKGYTSFTDADVETICGKQKTGITNNSDDVGTEITSINPNDL